MWKLWEKQLLAASQCEVEHSGDGITMPSPTEDNQREPLLEPEAHPSAPRLRRDSWAAEVPPGIIAYEREHSNLYETGAHWLQVRLTVAFLAAISPGQHPAF